MPKDTSEDSTTEITRMSEDKIYSNPMPKDTSEDSTTGTNISEKMSGEVQAKGNDQSSEEANCCQLNVDEMGLLKLKITILAVLCVILGSFLVAFQVLYFLRVENADKLGMPQEECDNATATAMTRSLEANLTETERMLIEQKNRNDDLTKENTKLKTELQGAKCADDWEYFDGSCYHFSTDVMNWTESRDACVTMGGHLVIITSQQEMDFLKTKTEHHWIGLTDVQEEGKWRWVDNTPLTNPKLLLGRKPAR
ncbi:C-type lectin domain family 4 member F-like [Clupea harengus]|uniref:C-type lectin domain family 4 member F-like n=1 Tax=Clupea harengus TaxID=7950 RepID=A0A6P8GYS2_CLUHA|nr:C-type lectin domain family 4 member F-like [Clupea harengus]